MVLWGGVLSSGVSTSLQVRVLKRLRRFKVRCLVLDLEMPIGRELCKKSNRSGFNFESTSQINYDSLI